MVAPGQKPFIPFHTNHLERSDLNNNHISLAFDLNLWYNVRTMFRIRQVKLDAKTLKGAEFISKHGRIFFMHCIGKAQGKEQALISKDLNPDNGIWIDRLPEIDFVIWEEQVGPLLG